MELIKVLKPECCKVCLISTNKEEALREISSLLCRDKVLCHIGTDTIYDYLSAREKEGSTGLGRGLAFPHARIKGIKEFVVGIALSKKGIVFDSIDKKKARLFFYIIGPTEATDDHLKILASISSIANKPGVQKELLNAKSDKILYEILAKHIANLNTQLNTKEKMKLIIIILYFEEFLHDILEYLLGKGIDGATILDSSGMGRYISNVPLFAEFIGFMQERKDKSKTIIALIPANEEKHIVQGLEEITGDMDDKQGAMFISLDIGFYKGTMKML